MVDFDKLCRAFTAARQALLDERTPDGHWEGRLSSSALSTATAVSALALVRQQLERDDSPTSLEQQEQIGRLIFAALDWLVQNQNPDGGWGDTNRSLSNIASTMLVRAALQLTCVPANHVDLVARADQYIRSHGGVAGLRRRYGRDKTFAVPILTNCALAGLVSWREVSPLPFELACFPQSWFRFLRLPVVSYAIPALVAIGQARYFHRRPLNPLVRWWRAAAVDKSLRVLEMMQPASGGFLEATPLTSFVVMSLASIGQARHPVARRGLEFLLRSAREDGSWPIDTNLATWLTTLSLNALAAGDRELAIEAGEHTASWLLGCQARQVHPYTGAAPGGWGWSDLTGSVPDADDSSGALLALASLAESGELDVASAEHEQLAGAAVQGIEWLLDLQNRDGGWPTFCRGWGKLPYDRSGTDLTAHAIRALHAWRAIGLSGACTASCGQLRDIAASERWLGQSWRRWMKLLLKRAVASDAPAGRMTPGHRRDNGQAEIDIHRAALPQPPMLSRSLHVGHGYLKWIERAIDAGFEYLARQQQPDGAWVPLWFGNQHHPLEQNPIYGTARVLLAYSEVHRLKDPAARRGLAWLASQQRSDGAWGSDPSVEETALAVEALLAAGEDSAYDQHVERGLEWLVGAVESGRFRQPSPIGFYFAKLWYYEALYPVIFTVAALGRAVRRFSPVPIERPAERPAERRKDRRPRLAEPMIATQPAPLA